MTERLYYSDSRLTDFEARVVDVIRTDDGRFAVRLDRTAFYPTGGGQPADNGALGSASVVDCIDEEDGRILHVIEGQPPSEGAIVTGRVDWGRRLDHIQQHTGQHILSQAFVQLFDAETRSFRMSSDSSEIDVELEHSSDERVEAAVTRANEIIWDDRAVTIHNVSPDQASSMPLRKDSAREGELRIIEIENFDMSPCGGTHASRTGEVGLIAVRHWERAKGLTRITFVAGGRALEEYRRANRSARDVAALFSVARDEATSAVARLFEENKQLQRRVRALSEMAARAEARDLIEEVSQDGSSSMKIVVRVFEGRDAEELRQLAFAIVKHEGTVALLGSREVGSAASARIVFARSSELSHDMNALVREACATLEGRGGGRPDLAQGGGPNVEQLESAIETAKTRIRQRLSPTA
jgi:alanyl-tRNA synthetase